MEHNWSYYGLVLTNKSRNKLIDFLNSNKCPDIIKSLLKDKSKEDLIIHHCTLLHINQAKYDINFYFHICNYAYEHRNDIIGIAVDAIGYSENVIAFRCILPTYKNYTICVNKTPHITICTLNDGKPVDSNKIGNWINIDNIVVETKVKRI